MLGKRKRGTTSFALVPCQNHPISVRNKFNPKCKSSGYHFGVREQRNGKVDWIPNFYHYWCHLSAAGAHGCWLSFPQPAFISHFWPSQTCVYSSLFPMITGKHIISFHSPWLLAPTALSLNYPPYHLLLPQISSHMHTLSGMICCFLLCQWRLFSIKQERGFPSPPWQSNAHRWWCWGFRPEVLTIY